MEVLVFVTSKLCKQFLKKIMRDLFKTYRKFQDVSLELTIFESTPWLTRGMVEPWIVQRPLFIIHGRKCAPNGQEVEYASFI